MQSAASLRLALLATVLGAVVFAYPARHAKGQQSPSRPRSAPGPMLHDIMTAKPIAGALVIPTDLRVTKRFQGRLPAYYGEVVNQQQREEVYAIQRQYFLAIELLELYLERLKHERDTRIEAVLSPEQRKRVEAIQATKKQERREERVDDASEDPNR